MIVRVLTTCKHYVIRARVKIHNVSGNFRRLRHARPARPGQTRRPGCKGPAKPRTRFGGHLGGSGDTSAVRGTPSRSRDTFPFAGHLPVRGTPCLIDVPPGLRARLAFLPDPAEAALAGPDLGTGGG